MEAFIKGLSTSTIDDYLALSEAELIGELGVFALPFAVSVHNIDRIRNELSRERSRRGSTLTPDDQSAIDAILRGRGGNPLSPSEPIQVDLPDTEPDTEEEDAPLLRRRRPGAGAGAGPAPPQLPPPSDPGLRDVTLDPPAPEPVRRPTGRRRIPISRPTRSGVAITGALIATIASIYGVGAEQIKVYPDGTITIPDEHGGERPIPIPSPGSNGVNESRGKGIPSIMGSRIDHKYKVPRKGRYNFLDFTRHASAAASITGIVHDIVNNNIKKQDSK